MTRHPEGELQDLLTVSVFFNSLLQQTLGHALPQPEPVRATPAGAPDGVESLRSWLNLLDLATTPPMIREALLRPEVELETAEVLLRYYVAKPARSPVDREKMDVVVTCLYRLLSEPEGAAMEQDICRILGHTAIPPLAESYRQLAEEFRFVREDVEETDHFDALMDSGIVDRVRDIKARFGEWFYHPHVLATVAEHNYFFGRKFDQLFREAARQIKAFASRAQQQGGSVLAPLEGEITVKNLVEVEESAILGEEYERARRHLQAVSSYKKAVDRRGPRRGARVARGPAVQAPPATVRGTAVPPLAQAEPIEVGPLADAPVLAMANTLEEGRVRSMDESIRNFVRASQSLSPCILPLRGANLVLTAAEVEAFRADYAEEKSFRGDFARLHRHLTAVQARILSELEEFKAKRDSAYLWKPHADSLALLIALGSRDRETAKQLIDMASQRGLADKAAALNASVQRLTSEMERAANILNTSSLIKPVLW